MNDIKQKLLADVRCDCERCNLFKEAANRIAQLENRSDMLAQKLFMALRFINEERRDEFYAEWEKFVRSMPTNQIPEGAS
jgi:hypothetical protein